MEAVKQTKPSGMPPSVNYTGGIRQRNTTGYLSLDRALSAELPQPYARIHKKVRIEEAKLEEFDNLPYTAGVLCSVIAAFFLFGLVGVAIKEARQRKEEERKGKTTAVSIGSSKFFTRPAGFDVDQLGKRKSDNALCEVGSITSPGVVISKSSTSILPGLSSKPSSFDIDSLGKIRPHLEPEFFASIIAQDLTKDQKGASYLASNIIAGSLYVLTNETERYSPHRTGSDPSYKSKAIQRIIPEGLGNFGYYKQIEYDNYGFQAENIESGNGAHSLNKF